MTHRIALAALAVAAVTASVSLPSRPAAAQSAARDAEQAVVSYIVQDSVAEVRLASLALRRSHDPRVRAASRRFIADHTAAIANGMALARRMGFSEVERKPADEGVITYATLIRSSSFDRDFLRKQVSDHKNDIETVSDALSVTEDAPVARYERTVLAKLRVHLRLAQDALSAL